MDGFTPTFYSQKAIVGIFYNWKIVNVVSPKSTLYILASIKTELSLDPTN